MIALPLPPRECSPNWSGKLKDRMRAKRGARELAWGVAYDALDAHLDTVFERVQAHAHYTIRSRRYVPDDDNGISRLKNYRDGICLALHIDDRWWTWDGPPSVTIGSDEGVTITVWPVE